MNADQKLLEGGMFSVFFKYSAGSGSSQKPISTIKKSKILT